MNPLPFEDFEDELRGLSLQTRIPFPMLPVILGDIAGVLLQEARAGRRSRWIPGESARS